TTKAAPSTGPHIDPAPPSSTTRKMSMPSSSAKDSVLMKPDVWANRHPATPAAPDRTPPRRRRRPVVRDGDRRAPRRRPLGQGGEEQGEEEEGAEEQRQGLPRREPVAEEVRLRDADDLTAGRGERLELPEHDERDVAEGQRGDGEVEVVAAHDQHREGQRHRRAEHDRGEEAPGERPALRGPHRRVGPEADERP